VIITIDTKNRTICANDNTAEEIKFPLYSLEGFNLISKVWLKQEWNQLHWQSFSWFGFQIWQFPDDLLRLQEVLVNLKPDVILETGVSRGGSSIFFATMCRLIGKGRVISVDITIPAELRNLIEKSPYADLITLIEGDSAASKIIQGVKELIGKDEKVFVFLDSDHSKAHVLRELNAYSDLVSKVHIS
jgi:cephalosporin hydroxylase